MLLGAFGHLLLVLHGDKAALTVSGARRSSPSGSMRPPAAPPRVSLFCGWLRDQIELVDEPPTCAPAVKLAS